MPDTPLIGRVARPDFNILGLLMGGPRYMSQYIGAQDQAAQQEKQMGLNAQAAQGLLASPEFQQGTQQRDRPAWNLWARMQGGDQQTSALGSSLLERAVQQGYGQDMAKFNDALQKGDMRYSQQLQLETAQKLAQQNQQMTQDRIKALMDPNSRQDEASRNIAAKALGVEVPPGYSFTPIDGQRYGFKPSMGTPAWHDMMDETTAADQVLKGVQDLQTMAESKTDTQGAWESTKQSTMFAMNKLLKGGSMDQGLIDSFNKLVPDRWDNFSVNPKNWAIADEKLKTTLRYAIGQRQAVSNKWLISPNEVPNTAGAALPVVGRDIPPPPDRPPLEPPTDTTRKAVEKAAPRERWDRGKPTAPAEQNIWNTPGAWR